MKIVRAKPALMAAAILAPCVTARSQAPKSAFSDQLFAMAAADGGMTEVASSKLALQRATGADLKKFAQQMIDDHTKANRELMALAAAKGIAVPAALSIPHQAEYEVLGGLQGEEFDCAYAKQQFAAHICTVALFKAEAERGADPDVKAFASKTLPHLKEHLHMAHGLAKAAMEKEKEKEKKDSSESPK